MATPSQAQLVEERTALQEEIQMLREARQELINKGQFNAAKEYDNSIARAQATEQSLTSKIENYSTFSAERAAQDAEIAQTKDFETKTNPANQNIQTQTQVTETVTGGGANTVKGPDLSVTPDQAAASKLANQRASAFEANPNSRFSKGTIDRAEASGAITKEEADQLRKGEISEDQRMATASQARASSNATTGAESPPVASANPGNPLTPPAEPPTPTAQAQETVSANDPAAKVAEEKGGSATVTVNPDGTETVTPVKQDPVVSSPPPADDGTTPGVVAAGATNIENAEPKTPVDTEFGNLDAAIERQNQSQPILNEDGTRAIGIARNAETGETYYTGETVPEPPNASSGETNNTASAVSAARTGGVNATQRNVRQQEDWRVRLSLAPNATYLYNAAKEGDVLYPLKGTNGVIFPYTPSVNINYRANYDPADLTHSNYKYYFYKNSSVDDISITAEFTAQDTTEALYMLSVIHFFKSATKMFYGQDKNPVAGTPPPLCYLFGYGQYQFSDHPLVITNFQYNLPNDVDYIRAGSTTQWAGQNVAAYRTPASNTNQGGILGFLKNTRLGRIPQGAISPAPNFSGLSNSQATYVPTKMQMIITALPIITRRETATVFSLEKYAKGDLLKKGFW